MIIQKLLSFMLVLALLTMPALSLSEGASSVSFLDQAYAAGRNVKTTVTFTPGSIFAKDANLSMAADLLKVLKIESSSQAQGETTLQQFDLLLQDKSSLNLTFLTKSEEFHILSSLLGGKVLSFTMEEFYDLYGLLLIDSMESTSMDPSEMEAYRKSFRKAMAQAEQNRQQVTSFDTEAFITAIGFDYSNVEKDLAAPLAAWYEGIAAKGNSSTGVYESEKHDAAVTRKEMSISAAQVKEALEILSAWAIQEKNLEALTKLIDSDSNATGEPLSKDEVRELYASLPAKFEKEAANTHPKPITITQWSDAAGVLKALEIKMGIPDGSASDSNINLLFGQYEKTREDGIVKQYDISMTSAQEGITLTYTGKKIPVQTIGDSTVTTNQWNVYGSYTSDGQPLGSITLTFDSKSTATSATVQDEWNLGVGLSSSAITVSSSLAGKEKTIYDGVDAKVEGTVDLYLIDVSEPTLSIAYTTASGEPDPLPEIPTDSVRLGKMTMEELNAWAEEMTPVLQGQLMAVMGNLPPSIIKMIMGGVAAQ